MNCDICGRFVGRGGSWAHKYDMVAMGLSHEAYRCRSHTRSVGPIQSNARPHDSDMSPYQGIFWEE